MKKTALPGGFLLCKMKQIVVFLFLLFSTSHLLVAQKELISATTELIVAKKYDAAHHYLDSILKKNPKNIDALMMKGNVVLNHDADSVPPARFVTEEDQSVFNFKI